MSEQPEHECPDCGRIAVENAPGVCPKCDDIAADAYMEALAEQCDTGNAANAPEPVRQERVEGRVIPLRQYTEERVREVLTEILPYWLPKSGEGGDRSTPYVVNEIVRRLRG